MKLRVVFGILFGLVGICGLMGFLQGAMLFTGARALGNVNFWASFSFLAYATSVALLVRPWRFVQSLSSVVLPFAAMVLFGAGLILAYPLVVESFAADTCLDSGGSFDYVENICDHANIHPFIGLMWRNGFSAVLSFACLTGGVAFAWNFVRRIRAAPVTR